MVKLRQFQLTSELKLAMESGETIKRDILLELKVLNALSPHSQGFFFRFFFCNARCLGPACTHLELIPTGYSSSQDYFKRLRIVVGKENEPETLEFT